MTWDSNLPLLTETLVLSRMFSSIVVRVQFTRRLRGRKGRVRKEDMRRHTCLKSHDSAYHWSNSNNSKDSSWLNCFRRITLVSRIFQLKYFLFFFWNFDFRSNLCKIMFEIFCKFLKNYFQHFALKYFMPF